MNWIYTARFARWWLCNHLTCLLSVPFLCSLLEFFLSAVECFAVLFLSKLGVLSDSLLTDRVSAAGGVFSLRFVCSWLSLPEPPDPSSSGIGGNSSSGVGITPSLSGMCLPVGLMCLLLPLQLKNNHGIVLHSWIKKTIATVLHLAIHKRVCF